MRHEWGQKKNDFSLNRKWNEIYGENIHSHKRTVGRRVGVSEYVEKEQNVKKIPSFHIQDIQIFE